MEVRSLSTRAVNAERRLNNAQNQLLATEEKISALNQRNAAADMKWEARVKEYESRLKLAEEKVKRERQGGKERAAELEANLKYVFCFDWNAPFPNEVLDLCSDSSIWHRSEINNWLM